ncbi:hypothetical protein [Novosphingobium sp.]|uniref:hypothetical protein n=1 Tax=Novosphingobium sp. TaxID=1874826 RepID=UPI00286A70EA|nr:hypothetical protein [Novosphingobium sp.]
MAADLVITGLIRRRREMAHDLLQAMARIDDLSRDLDALDHTLRLFDPGISLDQIPTLQSRPRPDWALRGEVVRIVFAILRDAPGPMPTRDLVAAVNRERGLGDEITFLHVKRVRKCLDRQRVRGALKAVTVDGGQCWQIA